MGKGSSAPAPTSQTVTQSNIPEYARPYFEDILKRGQAESYRDYTPYGGERIAGFAPGQVAAQQETFGMQTPGQFGTATDLATAGGLGSILAGQYTPGQFGAQQVQAPFLRQFQMGPAQQVGAQQVGTQDIQSAQTGFNPALQQFQMGAPDQFGQAQAEQYMSPYMQNVVDVQKRQAIEDAQKQQLSTNLAAARQGTYGGARQLLAGTEREKALGQQLGDIQARGLETAFGQAQQQFERDRAAQMGAQQANLQAALGVQELGTTTGLQTALANLTNEQQARVQSEANRLQAQGMNQEQALRAALSNQQAGLTVGQQNLAARLGVQELGAQTGMQAQLANQQYGLEAQRLAEQSRQFGGTLGLQGLAQAMQGAQTLGQLGTSEQAADLQRIQAQAAAGAEQRGYEQQLMDTAYADFLRQRDYPMEQLGYFSNLLRGMPMQMGSTQTTYAQPPSMASQIGGLGLAGLGMYNMMQG